MEEVLYNSDVQERSSSSLLIEKELKRKDYVTFTDADKS